MFEHNNAQNETICETSLFFELDNIPKRSNSARLPRFSKFKTSKTKEFCETSFKNGKLSAELTASYQCVLRFFQSTSEVLRLPRKIDARSYEVLHLFRKIILANLNIWYSKMQPLSGNQRPDLRATTACTFSTSQVPKVIRTPVFLTFWLGNVLRAWQLAKVVRQWCVCTFWLGNVLRTTTACFFISSLASWLRTRRFSKPTFRLSGAPNIIENTVNRDSFRPFRASPSSFLLLFLFYASFFWSFSSLCLFLPCSSVHTVKVWLPNFLRLLVTENAILQYRPEGSWVQECFKPVVWLWCA